MLEPVVQGTRYGLAGTVRRAVLTSSIGAVAVDPNRSPDAVGDESCWSDLEFCKNTKNWYCYGKAAARGVDLVVDPALQPAVNASLAHGYVHVRDAAGAHVLVFEAPGAAGRYTCSDAVLLRGTVYTVLALRRRCSDEVNLRKQPSCDARYPTRQALYETVICFQKGILPVH
ncbi:hypothetical protein SETIT_4G048400v2 [Setaria italica]|uniref:Uncharacterized protein n=1 Tax=Setaria italica TaxID=4555 RepID=K3Y237_SETIT|nr:hypothetical protein SETIT_4G048400v2 [Setaria italica]